MTYPSGLQALIKRITVKKFTARIVC